MTAADRPSVTRHARGLLGTARPAVPADHRTSGFGGYRIKWDVDHTAATEDVEASTAYRAGLLATARTRPTREQIIDALVMSPLSDTAGTDMRPFEQTADAVLALLEGGDRDE